MIGWRNLAFSAMDDATAKIQEAREALRDHKGSSVTASNQSMLLNPQNPKLCAGRPCRYNASGTCVLCGYQKDV